MKMPFILILIMLTLLSALHLDARARSSPVIDAARLPAIRATMQAAIAAHHIPGGVLWMERSGQQFTEAYGNRQLDPTAEPMKKNTIFDAASLTKVMATAPAIMLLVQDGKVAVDAPVSRYLPEYTGGGKEAITVKQLLLHISGTRPGIPRDPAGWSGYNAGIARAAAEPLINAPGAKFVYSDINYILLGEIVHRVSGQMLNDFVTARVFKLLGMKETGFLPSARLRNRIAPTTREAAGLVHGVVHDPTSRLMGGVAGHAGLFTTASDAARYCRMFLAGGRTESGRVLFKPATLKLMTAPVSLPGDVRRTMGWDVATGYSDARGDCFGPASFGHTGWTGTALWIDPAADAFVVLFTNRNHPAEGHSVKELRYQISTQAAEAMMLKKQKTPPLKQPGAERVGARNGIDALMAERYAPLKGARVGLVTNHTGRAATGESTIDLLAAAPGMELRCLFSPEHGLRGVEDKDGIRDGRDSKSGLPVYSLYGSTRRPLPDQLKGLNTLIFDIQDIGCRFYTYISTLMECLEALNGTGIRCVVLDRINPVGGSIIDGPLLDGATSFTACHPIPVRHGMTVGELAQMFITERQLDVSLTVVRVEGWSRNMDLEQSGLPWVNPSPNMRSLDAAAIYPGIGLLEFCNVSVGRGTDTPFLLFGAPWVDGPALAAALDKESFPGLKLEAAQFRPRASVFAGKECHGVRFHVTDRGQLPAVKLGVALASALQRQHPDTFKLDLMQKLLCSPAVLESIRAGKSVRETAALYAADIEAFRKRREPFLLYR